MYTLQANQMLQRSTIMGDKPTRQHVSVNWATTSEVC